MRHKTKRLFQSVFLGISAINSVKLIILIGIFSITVIPYLFTRDWGLPSFKETGQIGDTINGVAGPFIALIAAFVTYLAFFMQYRANRIQIKQFKEQRRQFEKQITEQRNQFNTEIELQKRVQTIEQFEQKFYEMLRLHRANVEEMHLSNLLVGRKLFVELFYEFRYAYYIVQKIVDEWPKDKYDAIDLGFQKSDSEAVTKIAYHIFFHGIGVNSNPLIISSLKHDCSYIILEPIIAEFTEIQQDYERQKHRRLNDGSAKQLFKTDKNIYKFTLDLGEKKLNLETVYKPFDGHLHRLGHYYRHLFQTVKFVSEYDPEKISPTQKYQYLKTLRAQLSSHEQLLLYYNSLSNFGSPWNKNKFITDYKLIKNLPLPLADFGLRPQAKYVEEIATLTARGEDFFEWT